MAAAIPATLAARRRAIHARARELGLDEPSRREAIAAATGQRCRSTTELDLGQAGRVLAHLDKIAAAQRRGGGQRPAAPGDEWRALFHWAEDRRVLGRKIYRQAQRLGALQAPPVAVMSMAYIEGIAAQMGGANAEGVRGQVATPLGMCDAERLRAIVIALDLHIKRRAAARRESTGEK